VANNDTRRLRVVVTGESSDAQQALEQVGSAAEDSQSKLVTLAKTIGGMALKGSVALGALGAAAATMGFSTATQLEQVSVGFTTMLGSAEKAQKFLKQLQQFANSTPFEFEDVTGAAQKFLSMGFAAKDVIPMLTAVGDAVAAMGGGAEQIDSVTTALTQMQIKGKVSGEEIMQLSEQGVPAIQILADSFKVSTGEMSKMISNGDVLSKQAIPLIIKGLEQGTKNVKGFGGMMQAQSETMAGKWSTFMDTLKMGLGNLATIFLPAVKKGVDTLSIGMGAFFNGIQGKADKTLNGFASTINNVGLGLKAMISAFKEGDITSDGLVGKFESFGLSMNLLVQSFKDGEISVKGFYTVAQTAGVIMRIFYDAVIATVDATKQMVKWLQEHDTVAKALVTTMTALYAITKAYAITTAIQAAGGIAAMVKQLTLVASVMKTVTAVQWAYNGAVAAASYLQIAGYLSALAVAQKAVAVWTKIVTAAQWLWNQAMKDNPIGAVITVIALLVAAVIYLFKHNKAFHDFVVNKLWPGLKAVWNALRVAFVATVNAMVDAWNWLKKTSIAVWNAIAGFVGPIVQKIYSFIKPIIDIISAVGSRLFTFYNNTWKVVWILIQIAVKVFIWYLQNVVWPAIQFVFNKVSAAVKWLYNNAIKPYFLAWKYVIGLVVDWIRNTAWPFIKKVWDGIKIATQALANVVGLWWNAMVSRIKSAISAIVGPAFAKLKGGFDILRKWLTSFRDFWSKVWDGMRIAFTSIAGNVVKAFGMMRDGIKKAWDAIKAQAKAPVNFVVNEIYNDRIVKLFNKVADKFGIKTRLDTIKGFARGGVVGNGYGSKDDQLAMLTRGEGVLTTSEMKKLGGPSGFNRFRESLAMYNKGGVVGGDGIGSWISNLASKGKDIIQGIAGSAIKPLVNTIRNLINSRLANSGFSGVMRGGANTMLNGLVSWVSGKDKEAGAIGGGGGQGMGWANQMKVLRSAFPGLALISGFRPGAHTLSGNLSYHASGRAVDVPAIRAVAMWIRQHFGSSTKELITPWPELDLRNGKFHDYDYAIDAQHGVYGNNAHVHWAMDSASVVQPGWFAGYNGTGKPEKLANVDLMKDLAGSMNVTINIYDARDPKATAKAVRDELLKLGGRNGGRAGLPKN
jgi:tape measure domain-containing protein